MAVPSAGAHAGQARHGALPLWAATKWRASWLGLLPRYGICGIYWDVLQLATSSKRRSSLSVHALGCRAAQGPAPALEQVFFTLHIVLGAYWLGCSPR